MEQIESLKSEEFYSIIEDIIYRKHHRLDKTKKLKRRCFKI